MAHLRLYLFDSAGKLVGAKGRVSNALMPGMEVPGARVDAAAVAAAKDKYEIVTRILCYWRVRGREVGAVGLVCCPSTVDRLEKGYEVTFAAVRPQNQISAVHARRFDSLELAVRHLKLRVRQIVRSSGPSSVSSTRKAGEAT